MTIDYTQDRCFKVLVTPELAQEWLNRNYCNRTISQVYVNAIAKDMASNKFVSNGATIVFSKTGELLDGQHRLSAIVKSGVSQQMLIATGIEKTPHFDDGRKRSIRDQILAMGKATREDPFADNHCISVTRYICTKNQSGMGRNKGTVRPSTESVFYWMVKHEEAITFIFRLAKIHGGAVKTRRASILAAELSAFEGGKNPEDIIEWDRVVRTGEYNSDKQLSAIAFRNYLISADPRAKELLYASYEEQTQLKAEYSIRMFNCKKVKSLKAEQCYPFPKWDVED